jgi:hypothetical protein
MMLSKFTSNMQDFLLLKFLDAFYAQGDCENCNDFWVVTLSMEKGQCQGGQQLL